MCGIVLFRVVIVLFVAVEIALVVDTCCISIVSAAPICTSSRSDLWPSNRNLNLLVICS
jgi:hypothetical protein